MMWVEIDANLDLPEDGLLAVSVRNPYAKPDIRLVPVEPDADAMAKRFIEWTHEPEGETSVGTMLAEVWLAGIGGSE